MRFWKLTIGIVIFIVALMVFSKKLGGPLMNINDKSVLHVDLGPSSNPYSVDPLEYDFFDHHFAFTSVLSPIVSFYEKGKMNSFYFEKFEVNSDYTEWIFKIKKNIKFENGDIINPSVIGRSFIRIAFKMKENNSNSGLFENIYEYEKISSPSSQPKGITWDENVLKLKFKKTEKELLEKISFNIYAIAHPSDYDPITGAWKNPKKAISSGSYKIVDWTENNIKLELNKNFIINEKNFDQISISFNKNQADNKDIDFYINSSTNLSFENNLTYISGPRNFIRYLRFFDKNEWLSIKSNRELLRNHLLDEMSKINNHNLNLISSFFPLSIRNVKKFEFNKVELKPLPSNLKIKYSKYPTPKKSESNLGKLSAMEVIEGALKNLANKYKFELIPFNDTDKLKPFGEEDKVLVDIAFRATGVLIENPFNDIRFMFNSTNGIMLPDPTSKIKNIVSNSIFDVQAVNEVLWDDSFIIPLDHYAYGYWVRNQKVNFSNLNLLLPPIDYHYIERDWNAFN